VFRCCASSLPYSFGGYDPVVAGHAINLAQDVETMGVTSVAGFGD
jgi:hypothetical protein